MIFFVFQNAISRHMHSGYTALDMTALEVASFNLQATDTDSKAYSGIKNTFRTVLLKMTSLLKISGCGSHCVFATTPLCVVMKFIYQDSLSEAL